MASACQLKSEGGLNSHRTQQGLIDCTGGGTEFLDMQNARTIFYFISFCFCVEYHETSDLQQQNDVTTAQLALEIFFTLKFVFVLEGINRTGTT